VRTGSQTTTKTGGAWRRPYDCGPIVRSHYQMLEFAVRDADGHVLGFGEAL
jgi:hypothetical protein